MFLNSQADDSSCSRSLNVHVLHLQTYPSSITRASYFPELSDLLEKSLWVLNIIAFQEEE